IGIKPARGRITMMPIGTSRVPYRVPGEGTWQWVDLWNTLDRERVIFIGQNIDEEFSNTVDNSYINGPGGDVSYFSSYLLIYDTMQSLQSPIDNHCVGYAYNLAGFLLAAGEMVMHLFFKPNIQNIVKKISADCGYLRIALESPTGAACGQADDIQNEANELLRIRDYLFKELAQKPGQPVEHVHKELSRIRLVNAQEALDYGLIVRIVSLPV
ncbi:ATP-dependent Clp protease proteolytic subunit-related protein 2, chloroplastic-like protein, partial [Tanacetum coccineum]